MPIYEYHCEKCDRIIERIQKFSDEPLTTHEGCGGKLTKLISQSSFQLKGSGWYVTDYAPKGSGGDKGESGPAQEATSKTEKSSSKEGSSTREGSGETPKKPPAEKSKSGAKEGRAD